MIVVRLTRVRDVGARVVARGALGEQHREAERKDEATMGHWKAKPQQQVISRTMPEVWGGATTRS
jgi:hypothetical protein